MQTLIKIIIVIIIISSPSFLHAECTDDATDLIKKNGDMMHWDNCSEEGDKYCNQKSYGKVCLPKDMFKAVKKAEDAFNGAIVIRSQESQTKKSSEKTSRIERELSSMCRTADKRNLSSQELGNNISKLSTMKSVILYANMDSSLKYAYIEEIKYCVILYEIQEGIKWAEKIGEELRK